MSPCHLVQQALGDALPVLLLLPPPQTVDGGQLGGRKLYEVVVPPTTGEATGVRTEIFLEEKYDSGPAHCHYEYHRALGGQENISLELTLIGLVHHYLDQGENLPDIIQSANVEESQSLEEPAASDDHEQFSEEVEVSLKVLHGSVVHELLANLFC